MNFFPYLFMLTLASIIHFNMSNYISSFGHGHMQSKTSNLLSKGSFGRHLRDVERRIFGGKFVTHKKHPFLGYLLRITIKKKSENRFVRQKAACGAIILSNTFAMSAANCFKKCTCVTYTDDDDEECKPNCVTYGADNYTLYTGNKYVNESEMITKLEQVYIHPEHKFVDTKHKCLNRFDIAVMKLATPLKFSDSISAIGLPKAVTLGTDDLDSTDTSKLFNNKKMDCLIFGWGLSEEDDKTKYLTEHLKIAKVYLIGLDECKSDFDHDKPKVEKEIENYLCTDTNICSKSESNKNGICSGDSGGPMICDKVLVGVSSWSREKCVGEYSPSVYTRVEVCVDWIKGIISDKQPS